MNTLILSGLTALASLTPSEETAPPSLAESLALQEASAPVAEPVGARSGFYARIQGGVGWLLDGSFDVVSGGSTTSGDASYDVGYLSGFALGWRFDERWSAELELNYRTNDIDEVDQGGGSTIEEGDYASLAITANGYYTFRPGERLRPYIGAGLGLMQEIDADFGPDEIEAEQGNLFVFQLMAGASYQISDPLSVSLEARYLGTAGPELELSGSSDTLEADYDNVALIAGLTYSF